MSNRSRTGAYNHLADEITLVEISDRNACKNPTAWLFLAFVIFIIVSIVNP